LGAGHALFWDCASSAVIGSHPIIPLLIKYQSELLRKSLGFGVFAEIFSKNNKIPSREIPFFGEAPDVWVTQRTDGYSGHLNG
jgi:hypothetical protein